MSLASEGEWGGGGQVRVSDWTTERPMPFLQPPSSPDDGVPGDFPDVDQRSCLLLGPTALVRTNPHSRPDAI